VYVPRVGEVWQWGMHEPDPEVAERLRPMMLRRIKTEVLKDLPPKRRQDIPVELDRAQERKFTAALKKWDAICRPDQLPPFESMSAARAELAEAKIPTLMKMVEEYEEAGEPLLVFSAHRLPVAQFENRPGWAVITGDTSPAERTQIEDAFQRGELIGVAGTIPAMGVAITLTRASNAIFVDLDWTPALNAQAEDRIYRIGQDRGVLITRLIARHALDERLTEVLTQKQDLIESTVDAARRGGDEAVDPREATRLDNLADALSEGVSEMAEEMEDVIEAQEAYRAQVAALDERARIRAEEKLEREWQNEIRQRAESRNVEIDTEDEDDKRREPQDNVEEWALEGLQTLIMLDPDRAEYQNDEGFNKADGKLGRALAMRAMGGGLSNAEWQLATAMLAKYWRQIGPMPEVVEPLPPKGQLSLFNPADKRQGREIGTGRYAPSKFESVCTCGHTLGEHTAARAKYEGEMRQECLTPGCDCACYKKARRNPPYSGWRKGWWQKSLPADTHKISYKTKTDALNVFLDFNRAIVDDYGGESMKHSPESFEAINHRFGIEGKRRVDTIAKAVWWALPPGSPYYLEDIDVELLNETAPAIYNPRGLVFRIPDYVEEAALLEKEAEYWQERYGHLEYPEEAPF